MRSIRILVSSFSVYHLVRRYIFLRYMQSAYPAQLEPREPSFHLFQLGQVRQQKNILRVIVHLDISALRPLGIDSL